MNKADLLRKNIPSPLKRHFARTTWKVLMWRTMNAWTENSFTHFSSWLSIPIFHHFKILTKHNFNWLRFPLNGIKRILLKILQQLHFPITIFMLVYCQDGLFYFSLWLLVENILFSTPSKHNVPFSLERVKVKKCFNDTFAIFLYIKKCEKKHLMRE